MNIHVKRAWKYQTMNKISQKRGLVTNLNGRYNHTQRLFNVKNLWNRSDNKFLFKLCPLNIIIWELQFWNRGGDAHAPYQAVRHRKCPNWVKVNACYKNAFSVVVKSLWAQTRKNTHKTAANTLCLTQINILNLIQTESYIVVENLNPISWYGCQTPKR